jgi:cell wall-associated NlpC family hydrolase
VSVEIADRALSFVGTPFRHQGRLPGVGLDCLGVVVFACGATRDDRRDYGRMPDARALRDALDSRFERLLVETLEEAPIGAVLAFHFSARRALRHLGVRVADGFVHADEFRVRVQPIAEPWVSRFAGAYRWRA